MRRIAFATLSVLLAGVTAAAPPRSVEHRSNPPEARYASASVETLVVGAWTFDGSGGAPDPQGWTVHDRTGDLQAFFHVADTTELDGGDFGYLTVLEGNRSLWCGAVYATHPELCNYASLPGYGEGWDQAFVSRVYQRSGEVGIGFIIRYDNEAGYDNTTVYYRDKHWDWAVLWNYWQGNEFRRDAFTIPDTTLTDSTQIMFRFTESGFWNDETGLANLDGAVIIDSLSVWDGTGTLDFEDFEDEVAGALVTTDGDWEARNIGVYGTTAALFSGLTVAQDDTLVTNTTHLWGFFAGSTYTYSVGGHPEQVVVPYARRDATVGHDIYLHNEIWSPEIDWTKDENGNAIGSWVDEAFLEFDVYRDLRLEGLVFYTWAVRVVTSGCPGEWQSDGLVYYDADKQWYRHQASIGGFISPQEQQVQVAIGVVDMCEQWCGVWGPENWHSQAPLFDNVRVIRVGPVASSAGDKPAFTALRKAYPNPFNPATTIPFTLAERGHVRIDVFDVSGRLVRTLADGSHDAGRIHTIEWDGRDASGNPSASGVYFVRLTAGAFTQSQKITLLK